MQRLARQLRSNMTDAEKKLWQVLRSKQLCGFRFRRQVALGRYIVDFICYQARVVVELDGGQHNEELYQSYDAQRTQWPQEAGYVVMRFWNNEVFNDISAVLESILATCRLQTHPPSQPSPARGEGG